MTWNLSWGVLLGTLIGACQSCPEPVTCPACPECPKVEPRSADHEALPPEAAPLDYTKKLDGIETIEEAVSKVKKALEAQGFGVVSDMNIQETMKKKLDKEMPPYRILGACNPKFAYQALEKDKTMGLLLPCKVIVYQEPEGQYVVSFANPKTVFSLRSTDPNNPVAEGVDALVRAAFESL